MEKITKELIESLTPLERESAEWCYQGFQRWLDENKKNGENDENRVTIAHMVFFTAHHFQPGELEAFKSLHKKGIIFDLTPDEEMGGDAHEIFLEDTIVAVHKFLESCSDAER